MRSTKSIYLVTLQKDTLSPFAKESDEEKAQMDVKTKTESSKKTGVGYLGFPELMDGGQITAPNLAFWTNEGFKVENEGITPDIEVEQWPAEVIKGNDPQLQKAIEIILKELEKNPQKEPVRPPYPVKVNNEQ